MNIPPDIAKHLSTHKPPSTRTHETPRATVAPPVRYVIDTTSPTDGQLARLVVVESGEPCTAWAKRLKVHPRVVRSWLRWAACPDKLRTRLIADHVRQTTGTITFTIAGPGDGKLFVQFPE